jgi:hypothetical protein
MKSTSWLAGVFVVVLAAALTMTNVSCDENVSLGLSPGADAADTHPDDGPPDAGP